METFCNIHGNYHLVAILPTKKSALQNEVALIYRRVRGLHFLAVTFTATIISF